MIRWERLSRTAPGNSFWTTLYEQNEGWACGLPAHAVQSPSACGGQVGEMVDGSGMGDHEGEHTTWSRGGQAQARSVVKSRSERKISFPWHFVFLFS